MAIGATLDPSSKKAKVSAKVVFLLETPDPYLRETVLQTKDITFVVTARRRPFHNIEDFHRLELDPHTAKILVVKSGYLSPELAPIAAPSFMALSSGAVDQFVERLPRPRKAKNTYPFDDNFDWKPEAILSARARES